ncbi:hypothetical protein LSH36_19g05008 [Paralvinella palmiformis]|uniref:Uncharacterized protein n=1 Tax=Paralvinella palmiformis TaxID=53620 RepID=A0AAD9KAP1_9ANNE|nr:hypothetical protein LSH36_19g05008 [Paralvinella palmiformis]
MFRHPGRALTIYDITGLSGQAYYRPLIHANMKSGLAKKDIFPLNREVFTYDLLPPSVPTDREEEIFRDIPDEAESEPEDLAEDEGRTNPEEPIKFQNNLDPEPGVYVQVEYAGKDKKRHYIGLTVHPKDVEGDFEVKFLLKLAKHI